MVKVKRVRANWHFVGFAQAGNKAVRRQVFN